MPCTCPRARCRPALLASLSDSGLQRAEPRPHHRGGGHHRADGAGVHGDWHDGLEEVSGAAAEPGHGPRRFGAGEEERTEAKPPQRGLLEARGSAGSQRGSWVKLRAGSSSRGAGLCA